MAKYLKRGILCLMAFLSLCVLFTCFFKTDILFIDEFKHVIQLGGWDRLQFYIYHRLPRGIWVVLGGFDTGGVYSIYFKTGFMQVLYWALTCIEFLGAIGLCGLSVFVLIKGDNGIFSKIIMFGSLAIILLYFGQVLLYWLQNVKRSPFWQSPNHNRISEKIEFFFETIRQYMSQQSFIILLFNGILAVGYFFMGKMMPETE